MSAADAPRESAFARHPAARGIGWLALAFRMFAAKPGSWFVFVAGYLVLQLALGFVVYAIGAAGTVIALLLRPVLAVGFLAGAWSQERGEGVRVAQLFSGFRSNVKHLLAVGAIFPLALVGAIFASSLVDGGTLLDVVANRKPPGSDAEIASALSLSMFFVTACVVPAIVATWFAPALIVFQDLPPGRALRTSLRAWLANWRPILVYGLWLFALGAIVPSLLGSLIAAAMGLAPSDDLILVLLMPYLLPLFVTMQICDYVIYRDVFHPADPLRPSRD